MAGLDRRIAVASPRCTQTPSLQPKVASAVKHVFMEGHAGGQCLPTEGDSDAKKQPKYVILRKEGWEMAGNFCEVPS